MRVFSRIPAGAVLAALASLAVAAPASASPTVGHVYVDDNTAPLNTIAVFNRHADGTLTPAAGSPFQAGGRGTGSAIGSQGGVQIADHGRYLLATDAGSDQVSVLPIAPDGRLGRPSVTASGGSQPVSVAVRGHLVYVANAGTGGSDYTGFRLDGGRLRPLPGSTVPLPDSSTPGDVLFNPAGTNLVGTRIGSSEIDSFVVGPRGLLTPAAGSPFAAQGPGPFGAEFRPTESAQLFVSNAHGAPGTGSVSAFHVNRAGTLASIGASPFGDQQTAPCWVQITPDGRYLFTTNTGSGTISRYLIAGDGSLTLLGSTPMHGGALAPTDIGQSPGGDTLWVLDAGARALSGFAVAGGRLSEFGSSPTPLPRHAAPFGIAVN